MSIIMLLKILTADLLAVVFYRGFLYPKVYFRGRLKWYGKSFVKQYLRPTANSFFSTATFSYGGSFVSSEGNFGIVVDFVGWWSTLPLVVDGNDLCRGGARFSTLSLSKLDLSGLSGGRSGGCRNSTLCGVTFLSLSTFGVCNGLSKLILFSGSSICLSGGLSTLSGAILLSEILGANLSCLHSRLGKSLSVLFSGGLGGCRSCLVSGVCLSVGLSGIRLSGRGGGCRSGRGSVGVGRSSEGCRSGGGAGRGRLPDWGVQARRGFSKALGSGGTWKLRKSLKFHQIHNAKQRILLYTGAFSFGKEG